MVEGYKHKPSSVGDKLRGVAGRIAMLGGAAGLLGGVEQVGEHRGKETAQEKIMTGKNKKEDNTKNLEQEVENRQMHVIKEIDQCIHELEKIPKNLSVSELSDVTLKMENILDNYIQWAFDDTGEQTDNTILILGKIREFATKIAEGHVDEEDEKNQFRAFITGDGVLAYEAKKSPDFNIMVNEVIAKKRLELMEFKRLFLTAFNNRDFQRATIYSRDIIFLAEQISGLTASMYYEKADRAKFGSYYRKSGELGLGRGLDLHRVREHVSEISQGSPEDFTRPEFLTPHEIDTFIDMPKSGSSRKTEEEIRMQKQADENSRGTSPAFD
ncbi:MAG: hypothetical protein WCT11_01455 [Candidatus Magasanikbacteria bacterium]